MSILEDFRGLPRRQQNALGLGAAIILVLALIGVGAAAVQAAYLGSQPPATPEEAAAPPSLAAGPGDGGAGQDGRPAEADAYDDAEKEFVGRLMGAVWRSESGAISFTDWSFTETGPDKGQSERTFLVKKITKKSTYSINDTTEAIVEVDGLFTTMTLLPQAKAAQGTPVALCVECDAFAYSGAYFEDLDDSFEVSGIDSETVLGFIGNDGQGLKDALQAYCAENAPTASRATWDESCLFDFGLGTCALYFTLDNKAQTVLCALYDQATGSWTVKTAY